MKVSGFLWDDCDFSCDYDLLKELGIDIPYIAYDDTTTQGGRQKTLRGLNTAKDNDMQIIVTGYLCDGIVTEEERCLIYLFMLKLFDVGLDDMYIASEEVKNIMKCS